MLAAADAHAGMHAQGDVTPPAGGSAGVTMSADARDALIGNPYSRPIVEDHMRAMRMLQNAGTGAAFDMAYMERQVAAHRFALTTIDNLLPSLRSGGSPAALALATQMRASVEQHLRMAESIRAGMR
jgi:predicted outer membrane protein